jgi:hypothetical protein
MKTTDPVSPNPAVDAFLAPLKAAHTERGLTDARRDAIWRAVQAEKPQTRRPWLFAGVGVAFAAAAALLIAPQLAERAATAPLTDAPITQPSVQAQANTALTGVQWAASGAKLTPLADAQVQVLTSHADTTRLRVHSGAVRSEVPKLGAGQRYVVLSPVAEVEVRGTVFVVDARPDGSTRVVVSEGLVEVRPQGDRPIQHVAAGESVIIEPIDAEGAQRAQTRGEVEAAARIWGRVLTRGEDTLARRNRALQVGATFDTEPTAAALFWVRIRDSHPAGLHAEAFAFRAAQALHRSNQPKAARSASEAFRAKWPQSPRASETRGW